jgi:hypothetical protein
MLRQWRRWGTLSYLRRRRSLLGPVGKRITRAGARGWSGSSLSRSRTGAGSFGAIVCHAVASVHRFHRPTRAHMHISRFWHIAAIRIIALVRFLDLRSRGRRGWMRVLLILIGPWRWRVNHLLFGRRYLIDDRLRCRRGD